MSQANQELIEVKLNKEIDSINEDIKVLAQQNLGNLEDKMAELQKKIEEDVSLFKNYLILC
jgi:hypothetical protein